MGKIIYADIAKTANTKCEECKEAFAKGDVRVIINGHGFKFPKVLRYHRKCLTDLIGKCLIDLIEKNSVREDIDSKDYKELF